MEIEACINALEKLKLNLKKSKNKIFTKKYVEEKLGRLEELVNAVNDYQREDENDYLLKARFNELKIEISVLINELNIKEEIINNNVNMAQFDMSMVSKNLHVFKGEFKYLEDFISQAELLHDLLQEQDKELFIKYIYNFKLSAQVRSILGRSNKPTTFVQLKKALEDAYPNPRTLQQLLTELGTTKQGHLTMTSFREKISELCDELNRFEIGNLKNPSQETKDAIYKVNESMALNVFMKGVNAEYQPILLANMPSSLNEATQRCITAERSLGLDTKDVFFVNRTNRSNEQSKPYRKSYRYNYNDYNNSYRNNYNTRYNIGNRCSDNYGNPGGRKKFSNGHSNNRNNYQGNNNKNAEYKNIHGNVEYNNGKNGRIKHTEVRNYKAFPCTCQQGNSDGRMMEEFIQEAQN